MNKQTKFLGLLLALSFVLVLAGFSLQAEETVTCPVSGKQIKKSEAKTTYEYEGKTYYFCCEGCKEKFIKDPKKHLQKKEEREEVYTCPMHPEVKSDKPGKCTKCGMKLEKKMMPMKKMHVHMEMHKKEEGKCCCVMTGMIGAKDVELTVENVDNGVVVRVTSKNAEGVKKIQEYAAKMKQMYESAHKKEDKKEDVKN